MGELCLIFPHHFWICTGFVFDLSDFVAILFIVNLRTVFDKKRVFQSIEEMATAGFHSYFSSFSRILSSF